MQEHVLIEHGEHVMTLTLNRPDKKNALTRAMYASLAGAVARADEDADIRCIVLRAHGDMFTAGNDLADFMAIAGREAPRPEDANPLLPMLARVQKPLIAAVNGRAVGIGVTLLLHCDLVYVSDDAQLTTPFVNLALVPEAASSLLLPLRIGHARAFEMFVLGEPVNAEQAVAWGIANRRVPREALQATAHAAAVAVAARAPASVLTTKRLMRDGATLLGRMQEENTYFLQQLQSAEFREAFTAFTERRTPDFGNV
jgi:enoyl-CoA hydratase/carnithine racemase